MEGAEPGAGTVSDPARSQCFDNMQRATGPVGFYGCHGGSTQRWMLSGGRIHSTDLTRPCLVVAPAVGQFTCAADDRDSVWDRRGDGTLRPVVDPTSCLTRAGAGLAIRPCAAAGGAAVPQQWDLDPAADSRGHWQSALGGP